MGAAGAAEWSTLEDTPSGSGTGSVGDRSGESGSAGTAAVVTVVVALGIIFWCVAVREIKVGMAARAVVLSTRNFMSRGGTTMASVTPPAPRAASAPSVPGAKVAMTTSAADSTAQQPDMNDFVEIGIQ